MVGMMMTMMMKGGVRDFVFSSSFLFFSFPPLRNNLTMIPLFGEVVLLFPTLA